MNMQHRNSGSGSHGSLTHAAANTESLTHRGLRLRPENAFISITLVPEDSSRRVCHPVSKDPNPNIKKLDD